MLSAAATCTLEVTTGASGFDASALIVITGIIGIVFALWLMKTVADVTLDVSSVNKAANPTEAREQNVKLLELYNAIGLGARTPRLYTLPEGGAGCGIQGCALLCAAASAHLESESSLLAQVPTRSSPPSTSSAPCSSSPPSSP